MVSGAIPVWRRLIYAIGLGFMLCWFSFLFYSLGQALYFHGIQRGNRQVLFPGLLPGLFWLTIIVFVFWNTRRKIRAFRYDGKVLRWRTLLSLCEKKRGLGEILEVRTPAREGPYYWEVVIVLRGGRKLVLSSWVRNAARLRQQLHADLQHVHSA